MSNPVKIAGEADVALWFCRACARSGALLLNNGSVYDVIEALTSIHQDDSKGQCDGQLGSDIRLLKPPSWFGTANAEAKRGR